MLTRVLGMVLLLLSCACRRADPDCVARARALRDRTAAIDWSTVYLDADVSYADIPLGDGMERSGNSLADGDWHSAVVVDGSSVWFSDKRHGDDASLSDWLASHGGTFHGEELRWPFYVLATSGTRLGLIRRVERILRPLGGVRLTVGTTTVVEPWPPRADRKAAYAHTTRYESSKNYVKREDEAIRAVRGAAEGCSEAVQLTKNGMELNERLRRVPDAFEQCACKGDMDTMAALLWYMALEDQVPIRWHPWDEELIRSMGDDATYADLAKALTQRYLATKRP